MNNEIQPMDSALRTQLMQDDLHDPVKLVERVYELWRNWADFHLFITSPEIPEITPPVIHEPEIISESGEREFVYAIHDAGFRLSTSKSQDMFSSGKSMCKLFYTIEKMIALLVERLQSGGMDESTEVHVNFSGHLIPQRKAFEVIINLPYNVIVDNFDPGLWGDNFLAIVKNLAEKGYGLPSEAPRDIYKIIRGGGGPRMR